MLHRKASSMRKGNQSTTVIAVLALMVTATVIGPAASAQNYSIIYNLPVQANSPWGSLTIDAAGNLYGTTTSSDTYVGTAFELKNTPGGYVLRPLFTFGDS